ncbi:ABC transporter ATP-binding protein [Catenulispora sp. NL8]|uniref:ABC transporter ATP-binding protein n=1 Tax=Catenulispora pinistramenti TaxID=2705254 RepID=A0ABS5L3J6_9ACTN|nr:ABC transporter ATP-binding protein [Catenulispora pinistramenti]MBS2552886.1 ABC transporter ATP-binding protein [Catenulispora pinistramenti]
MTEPGRTGVLDGHQGSSAPHRESMLAIEDVAKDYLRGRRTLVQRLRGAPDQRAVVHAVDEVSLAVDRGEVVGMLGPNGAGKSTLVKIIATLLVPTRGSVRVCDVDVLAHPRQARRHLGVMLAGDRGVYWKLTGRENLEYFAALHFVPSSQIRRRVGEALEEVRLTGSADEYVERYSTGMRQRLNLARALIHEPEVLLLDEPTSGLDPVSGAEFRRIVRGLRQRGAAVLIATHDLAEAEDLCDRIAVLDRGRIAFQGSVDEAKTLVPGSSVLTVEVEGGDQDTAEVAAWLSAHFRVGLVERHERSVRARLYCESTSDLMAELPGKLHAAGLRAIRTEAGRVSLTDVFFSITDRRAGGGHGHPQ